jgi:5'-3' exonuclease
MKLALPPLPLPPECTCYIDLTGFLHRLAYMPGPHGLNPQQVTSKRTGEPTWGLVGTFNQLNTLAKLKPDRIIAFADSSADGFRAELLPSYKRKSSSPYLRHQIARLAQCLPYLGIAVVGAQEEFPGMEAEDLIAKAVRLHHGGPAVIVSYDKDLLQLVRPNVSHYNPQKKQLLTAPNIEAHLKQAFLPTRARLDAADLAVFLACTGDESDGIKPIGGVGPVTLGQYYEKIPTGVSNQAKLEALAAVDKRTRDPGADWNLARLNLAATDLDTPRQNDLILGTIPEPSLDKGAFQRVLEELTMISFLKKYDSWFAPFARQERPLLSIE